jgi:prevent-host-death family protein
MTDIKKIPATDLARQSADILRMAQQGQTFEVQRHGKPLAYVISPEDFAILEAIKKPSGEEYVDETASEGGTF